MPEFSLTDSLDQPVDIAKVNFSSGSALFTYLRSDLLHLAVAPDFIERKDKPLAQAAPKPTTFVLSAANTFSLGSVTPEVAVAAGAELVLTANATPGADLFKDDSFRVPATVPDDTAFVGMSIRGSLDLGISSSSGDLTFGVDSNAAIAFEFWKAFQPDVTLGAATAGMLSNFVIPSSMSDLSRLTANDVCAVSGQGSLMISGAVNVMTPVNPLASVNLPPGTGSLSVQDGAMAGISASLTLSGSYQIRIGKLDNGGIRLSYLKDRGSSLEVNLTASAGVSATFNGADLLAKLLGAIGSGHADTAQLASLSRDEIASFNAAIKAGIDHSLKASLDLALSTDCDNQAAFQYEIRPELLDASSRQALNRALKGDLRALTALEDSTRHDGPLAPGIRLLNSVLSTARTKGCSLRVNLLGIVNLISMSKLLSNCEFLFEPATGELTIKETAQSERISAIVDPLRRQEALRHAMFYSVLATTTYVVGRVATLPTLGCSAVHFALNEDSGRQTIADYTKWFVALNLMKQDERAAILAQFSDGGPSTCAVRLQFDDARCEAMFFDKAGALRSGAEYLEIGRSALLALLDPNSSDIDGCRYRFLDDPANWTRAVQTGPSPEIRELIPLNSTDPRLNVVLAEVTGDLYDIVWWADNMRKTGEALRQARVAPASDDHRSVLQKLMLNMVAASKARFHEPWGLICLFQAAGSTGSSGSLTARNLLVSRGQSQEITATAGQ